MAVCGDVLFPFRKVQHVSPSGIIGPNLIDRGVRCGKAWVCFSPEVEQRLILLFAAVLAGILSASVQNVEAAVRTCRYL